MFSRPIAFFHGYLNFIYFTKNYLYDIIFLENNTANNYIKRKGVLEIMTKRERMLNVLANKPVDRVPVAFFRHFTQPGDWNMGLERADAFERNIEGHRGALEKFNPDVIKVMNDTLMMMPMDVSFVEHASDLAKIQPISVDCEYAQKQIELTRRVLEIYKGCDAPVYVTAFSAAWVLRNAMTIGLPVAGADEPQMRMLMEEDPEAVGDCLMRMSEGIAALNRVLMTECGADGIYFSVANQAGFFPKEFHQKYVAPSEKYVLAEAKKIRDMNIVHICGYHGHGNDLSLYTEYGAAAYSLSVNAEGTTMADAKKLFGGAPVIGGFTQDGVIYKGTREEVKKAVWNILDNAGQTGVVIGADCTVPNDIDDDRFNWVRDAAAEYAKEH